MNNATKRLSLSLAVTLLILAGEVIGGILSNSLALISDAGHVLTDVFALGLSLVAALIGARPSDYRATYGYQRVGLLAALINGISLVVIAVFIFAEAYRRLRSPVQINPSMMFFVAVLGLFGNLLMAWILGHRHGDLNLKSAWLHVLGDTVSSAGVIIAAVVIRFTGWQPADAVASIAVGVIIIIGGWRVVKEAMWVFLELSPIGLHAGKISESISSIPGVRCVHDVHIWSIAHAIPAFSAHVQVADQKLSNADIIRKEIEHRLSSFGVSHSCIQMECEGCDEDGLYCRINGGNEVQRHHH
ncbi:MAG: cation diffusion facilitator family transporter [Dissulfurimicrobium sp.]|uniref:cation diffusion facilitator family transporter n=1 Tax=Dissulfurimicrobium TaxID=1769732 RepID=UPI001EDC8C69|nr:cation diffusion facilitator family transporter [Dissulfurimicrobium hydrothermale]UKL13813.1 cation diffusion facilitator family transporter [Dissulfurimicrobium hydrothermale]